jgi:hypothetical protein
MDSFRLASPSNSAANGSSKPLILSAWPIVWVLRISSGRLTGGFADAASPRECTVALSFLYLAILRTLQFVRLRRGDADDLAIEVIVLRHEVAVLKRQVARPALRPADRALLAGLSRLMTRAGCGRFFVQPETLLRWHRELVRRKWT